MWIRMLVMALVVGACAGMLIPGRVNATGKQENRLQEQIAEACQKGNVYAVVQDGSGDFTSVQEGVDAVASGDTLLIYPGVYEEAVEIYNKTVNLLGVDRNSCILQYESTQYNAIPLTFGAGNIANLTIYGYDKGETQVKESTTVTSYDNSSLESIREWQKNFSGYALHIDQNYTYGQEAYVENCRIVSNNNQSIGIGCRGKSKITFDSCELISNGTGGCIYFHNTDEKKLGGNAYFIMKDCELVNYISPYVISVQSLDSCNPVYLTFQNVKTSTIAYEEELAYNEANMNTSFDIDTVMILEQANLLQQTGYYSGMKQELICAMNSETRQQYTALLKNGVTPDMQEAVLTEGIHYIKTGKEEDTVSAAEKVKRHTINIINNSQKPGDGWCGLDSIYLTPDSFGNTLIEMNYPIAQSNTIMTQGSVGP